jgi:hypothetical protein
MEPSSVDPVVFKPKEVGSRNDSGDVDPQRNMVRGRSCKRREDRVLGRVSSQAPVRMRASISTGVDPWERLILL